MRKIVHLAALVVIGFGTIARADDGDGPGRGVARISVINGDVSVRRGDSGDVIAAAVNSPLVVQDRLLTGTGSRAEIQFDWANMIRLSGDAEVRLAELEYKRYIVQVARGTVTFRVLRDQEADVELSTPSVSVRPVKRGTYRITVHEDGTSEITVRSGEAEIFTPKGSERLKSGRTMVARGTAADPEFRFVSEIADDDWDRWNIRRDKDLEKSQSYSYVSRDIYGADDLDPYGRWVHVSSYGWVWSPRVAVGWAPYRHGRWSWVDYYGWSWVSYDPWGWAPYHYGRWFYSAPVGWCWWPGAIHTRHYWSPGLVAFFGFGSAHVGFGFGNVGWVPLAPYERYYPWYGRGYYGGYRNNSYANNGVRIVNNVNITNVYRNSRVDHAVTVVDQDGFGRGRAGNAARIHDAEFSRASVMQGQLPLAPGRESLRLADRDAAVRPVEGRANGQFFARRQPAAVDRVPFEDQRRGLEQAARRTFASEDGARAERANVAGASGSENGRGLRLNGEGPRGQGATDRAQDSRGQESRTQENGWRSFGSPRVESQGAVSGRSDHAGQFGQPGAESNRAEQPAERGWRRVGEGASRGSEAAPRTAERSGERSVERSAERSSDGVSDWRRFGGSRTESSNVDSGVSSRTGQGDDGWRRNIGARGDTGIGPRGDAMGRGERQDNSPRVERRNDAAASGGGDSVQISPPIVRERGTSFDRGWGGRSADRSSGMQSGGMQSAPAQAAPRGDGGGMRGSGGGGAPARGQGGGGGRGGDGGGSRGSGGGRGR